MTTKEAANISNHPNGLQTSVHQDFGGIRGYLPHIDKSGLISIYTST
jgi:hypothetical protein